MAEIDDVFDELSEIWDAGELDGLLDLELPEFEIALEYTETT